MRAVPFHPTTHRALIGRLDGGVRGLGLLYSLNHILRLFISGKKVHLAFRQKQYILLHAKVCGTLAYRDKRRAAIYVRAWALQFSEETLTRCGSGEWPSRLSSTFKSKLISLRAGHPRWRRLVLRGGLHHFHRQKAVLRRHLWLKLTRRSRAVFARPHPSQRCER